MKQTLKNVLIVIVAVSFFQCSKENNNSAKTKEANNTSQTSTNTTTTTTNSDTTTTSSTTLNTPSVDEPVVLAYFPSWSENWVETEQNSKLREVPAFVNHIFLAFAKPNLSYQKGSYNLDETGIEVPYDGCALAESVNVLKEKGIKVILSVGGETYWRDASSLEIDYQQIKDLVDDIGFAGIDWDFEPQGSFENIGSEENVNHFIEFFTRSRNLMPREEGYLLACAPAGAGALGGTTNDDLESPFRFEQRNNITGETDDHLYQVTQETNGINLFGLSFTGHMIPVIKAVGDKIDLIAYQGYNTGGSYNRKIMYDAYAYYARQYGFKVVAGTHFPPELWGPFYTYTHENIANLSHHIFQHPAREGRNDGIMIWQLLLAGEDKSSYSFLNVASRVLNGTAIENAVNTAMDYSVSPYTGGNARNCE